METKHVPRRLAGCHCDLAHQGAPQPTTPTCEIQTAAAAIGCPTTSQPGEQLREELGRGRTGRQVGTGGERPPRANLLSSRSLSARNSHLRSFAKTQPHSSQLQPSPPAPPDRLGRLRSRARHGFPALLFSAFASAQESALNHCKLRKAPAKPVITAQEGEGILL